MITNELPSRNALEGIPNDHLKFAVRVLAAIQHEGVQTVDYGIEIDDPFKIEECVEDWYNQMRRELHAREGGDPRQLR